jgi:hypothetical protein
MFKKVVRQDGSERGGEAYSFSYVEPPSDATTPPEAFFNILITECARRVRRSE